jgi:signal transduction histidine kinase
MSAPARRPPAELLVRRLPERRAVVLVAAAAMLVAIFAAMRQVDDPAPGIGVLAVLPITLIALELGLAGGLAAAALSAGLLALNAAGGHPELGATGVATRTLVFLAVGLVAGRFSDRMRDAFGREQRLLDSGLDLAGGIRADHVAAIVARAAARTPGVRGARVVLAGAEPAEAGAPGHHRATLPIAARGTPLGELEVSADRALASEERAALELLALQAGLAVDSQRLLAREREFVRAQEDERRRVADRLHDELAQMLTAVLMGLRVVSRDAADRAAVEDLRTQVVEVLRELREVAGSLRPVALDQLGLRPALETLAAGGRLSLDLEDDDHATGPLDPAVETSLFRIVQEALAGSPEGVRVGLSGTPAEVTLDLRLPAGTAVLPAIQARAEVAGGRVEATEDAGALRVRVALPR